MNDLIKQELHQLVDNCNNEILLEEAKVLFQTGNETDWWDDLSEEDKKMVIESEAEYCKGDFINHEELMMRFQEWKKK